MLWAYIMHGYYSNNNIINNSETEVGLDSRKVPGAEYDSFSDFEAAVGLFRTENVRYLWKTGGTDATGCALI